MYKVVRSYENCNDYGSLFEITNYTNYSTKYTSYPKKSGHKLFCFKDLADARCFVSRSVNRNYKIFEVEVENPVLLSSSNYNEYTWLDENIDYPFSTYLVDSVKLIKEV